MLKEDKIFNFHLGKKKKKNTTVFKLTFQFAKKTNLKNHQIKSRFA